MDYEEILKKHSFLNIIESQHGEHVEVSEDAVQIYSKDYDIYKSDWEFHKYRSSRNQMSTRGAWLSKKNAKTIDIAGDILTAKSAFMFLKDKGGEIERLCNIFERLYHTLGNCMPWCEGANLGGRPYKAVGRPGKAGGSPDYFTRKLKECKNIFDETDQNKYKDYDIVSSRIKNDKHLGRGVRKYTCLYYWIKNEWKDKGKVWKDFVNENYLIDMVDENYEPISFIVGQSDGNLAKVGSHDVIKSTLIQSIKLVIKRGYRIENHIKEPFLENDDNYKKLQKIFSELEI